MEQGTACMQSGRRGEEVAREFLRALGYRIHACNVRMGRDEIDIVAYDAEERVLVFAEVKSRTRLDPDFPPELAVTAQKKRSMQRAAERWVRDRGYEGGHRLDAVYVAGETVVGHVRQLEVTTA